MKTQTETKHTPTPWRQEIKPAKRFRIKGTCLISMEFSVALILGRLHGFCVEDREFIVRAVNAHEALVEALSIAHAAIVSPRAVQLDQKQMTDKYSKALALAEGK